MPPRIRLSGAASVVDGLVGPHRAAVERAAGVELAVEKSNAGKGLKDLVEGRCDAALISASLEACLDAARKAGLDRPAGDLRAEVVGSSEVVFAVHPGNPVRALSWEQIRDLHTGRIARWSEVGGEDLPVAVYTDAAASATRALVQQAVLGGAPYAAGARALPAVADVNAEVARDRAGIGALGLEFAVPGQVRVLETRKLLRPFSFVTRGEPPEVVRRVMEAYRALARR